ncbi:aminopeptidase [Oceanirhabdus sp. W0125-5]|uniref:aminopeptidase n=1 Tax=Oceanirhabdus sp. W0125-5 TaxID=2999116 RepID=UPI0022F2CF84|nr:aminopeptidase [Oceanirhabdus sp. W0125-5]WBW98542.1 aminopeptidase [Oceanirhabdus sp. W0125-5]
MFDFNEYYRDLNVKHEEQLNETLKVIKKIKDETEKCSCNCGDYGKFFSHTAGVILELCEHERELNEEYFKSKTFDELLEQNHKIYRHYTNEAYETSYANPAYCVSVFGEDIGQILCYFYMRFVNYIEYAYKHKRFKMAKNNELFIEVFNLLKCDNQWEVSELKEKVIKDTKINLNERLKMDLIERLSPEVSYYVDMIKSEDLNDLRYLFKYGKFIDKNEIKTAEFYNKYDSEKIKKIADTYTEGFRKGFVRDNKDLSKKQNVQLRFNAGQEMMMKEAIKNFEDMGLKCIIGNVTSTEPNKQMPYDHRFDNALYLDKEFVDMRIKAFEDVTEEIQDTLRGFAGPAVVETFGEKPFSPESKKECLKLNDDQSQLFNTLSGTMQQIQSKYMPRSEYSFTIIAFPVPEIGENFEEIFEDTCEVNMLDSDKYERIQQHIIDALDKGEYIHVKGKGTNETDIMVKNQKINNPEKETNYVNCVADVNIPVGEVFTSPQLTGTNGVLHVEEVYLRELKFENLKITFKDGYIDEYTCSNFDNEEDNKKYIQENLMFPHKTLPLGEFAIGTNTTAYVMANKHEILNILPILIVEKMGPHFAIGDTCFSWSEDVAVYNPTDGKEIIARDNEKSILRKTNLKEAYTQCHTDITLPYEGLDFIAAITESGEKIEIIKDGRFVLKGTEELNKPFEK